MIPSIDAYRELLTKLLIQRELDGVLSDEIEAEYAEELDRHWWAMTAQEQARMEQELAKPVPPEAPPELAQEDQLVEEGGHLPPRREAA